MIHWKICTFDFVDIDAKERKKNLREKCWNVGFGFFCSSFAYTKILLAAAEIPILGNCMEFGKAFKTLNRRIEASYRENALGRMKWWDLWSFIHVWASLLCVGFHMEMDKIKLLPDNRQEMSIAKQTCRGFILWVNSSQRLHRWWNEWPIHIWRNLIRFVKFKSRHNFNNTCIKSLKRLLKHRNYRISFRKHVQFIVHLWNLFGS